jgi:hypothetical protein
VRFAIDDKGENKQVAVQPLFFAEKLLEQQCRQHGDRSSLANQEYGLITLKLKKLQKPMQDKTVRIL